LPVRALRLVTLMAAVQQLEALMPAAPAAQMSPPPADSSARTLLQSTSQPRAIL
jgi:hypothetical protein